MKKIVLALSLLIGLGVNAQINNSDFEAWGTDTIYFPGINNIPPDTFTCNNPAGWTSSNSLTGADSLGGVFFVTQSNDAYSGQYAIRMYTDTVNLPTIPNFPDLTLSIPGFALNGKFPITPSTLLSSGDVLSPVSIAGAGQPWTQRLSKIKGYYKYTPVFNPNTQANDTCLVWATLRKGTKAVADAIFKSNAATNGYQYFEATFNYYECDDPDTLVVLLASSVPNVAGILGGSNSGILPGSVFLVDSIFYENLAGNYNYPPIARFDVDTTTKNVGLTIDVKGNDEDCNDPLSGLTITVTAQPTNGGSATVANGVINYTPGNNYVGVDSFFYTLSDGSGTSQPARVRILVFPTGTGINEVNQVAIIVYPIPAQNVLNVKMDYAGKATARIYNMVGALVSSATLNNNTTAINTADLSTGIYNLQICDEHSRVIARSKFSISK